MASILSSLCLTSFVFVTASCLSVDKYVPPCEVTGCPPHKQCVDGRCIDLIAIGIPPGECWPPCKHTEDCRFGECVRRSTSCAAVTCIVGQICIDGICVDPNTCSSPCASGQVCKDGRCVCRRGDFYNGRCVTCPPGKIFKPCSNCPPTCEKPFPQACTKECKLDRYCVCPDGLLEHNGGCVKRHQCPTKCGYGEKPTACASFCVGTCKNPNPEICAPACDPNRKCECRKGFVQVSQHDTRCTLLQNCPRPQLCKKNCPPGSDCIDGRCQCRRRCPPNEHCPDGICECLPGHYRKKGVCVSLSTCSSSCATGQVCEDGRCVCRRGDFYNGRCVTCPPGKIFKACPSNCPLTCEKPFPQVCTKECNLDRYCVCPDGFLEHNGGCVKSDQCPNKCGYGEKPTACASFCVGTCKNPNPEICAPTCDPNRKCECRKGFVQVSQHDTRCTLLQNCPRPQLCKKNCPPGSDCIDGRCQCRRRCPPNEHCPDGICECLPGHYRKKGVCVSLSTCSSSCAPGQVCEDGRCVCRRGDFYNGRCVTCPPGKIFKACPSNCPLTCEKPFPQVCTKECNLDRYCVCPDGFLEHNGGCVKSDQCPNKCGYGEKPTACASFCVGTCKNPNPEICAPTCDPNRKCECRKGFVQVSQHDTRCTLLQNCPRPQLCKKNCPPGSDCIDGKCQCRRRCPPNEHCPDGICECLPGHYRKNGVCVSLSTCSSSCAPGQVCEDGRCVCRRGDFYNGRCVTCPPGKIFKACPSNCPLTCEKPFPQVCTEECNLDRYCVCPNGFLEHNGGCVKRYQCPNKQCRPRCKPGWKCVSGNCVCVGIYCP
ncbi:zonadhesin-like [Styela clava]